MFLAVYLQTTTHPPTHTHTQTLIKLSEKLHVPNSDILVFATRPKGKHGFYIPHLTQILNQQLYHICGPG
jgi:hypothetical protein